jgi:hypothetical protein
VNMNKTLNLNQENQNDVFVDDFEKAEKQAHFHFVFFEI